MTNPEDTLDRHARLAAEARALLDNGGKVPNLSQRERIDDILREIAGLPDETPKHPDNVFLGHLRLRKDHLSCLISDSVVLNGGEIFDELLPHMEARKAIDTLLNYFAGDAPL